MSTRFPQPPRLGRRVALASLLALSITACASGGALETAHRPAGATLEVVNRTPDDFAVSVRGRFEGFVGSGERARFRHLPSGPADVVAAPRDRGRTADREETIELAPGVIASWELTPTAASEVAPLPVPPPLASLRVANPTTRAVAVAVDGREVGRVFAGESQVFRDLSAGRRALVATTDELGLAARGDVELAPGDDNTWTVVFSGARLEVLNDTSEPVELRIDGVSRAALEPGERWTSEVEPPGIRAVLAVGQLTRRHWEATLELSTASPTAWRVAAAGAALRVRNGTGEVLGLAIAGRDLPLLEPGEETLIEDLEPGALRAAAVGQSTRMIYAFETRLGPGQRAEWTARPVRATVRVVNDSGVTALIYAESEATAARPNAPPARAMRLRAELAPGRAVLLDDLLPGPFVLEAVDPHGTWTRRREVDPRATPASTWVLERAAGAVTIANERPEDLDVFVDAGSLGLVEARTTRTFTGVLVGPRLIEVRGRRSAAVLRERVVVTEEAPAVARFEDPTATLEIVNLLGVALRTTGGLADQRAVVTAGATARFLVPARPHVVGLVDPDGVPLSWQVDPKPSEVVQWRVAPATTSLVVTNELDEDVAVTIDDVGVGSVGPGATATYNGVATGRRRFSTVGITSGRVRTLTEVATAARPVSWTLATRPGRILVRNGSTEVVEVFIDGRQYRTVEAGAILAFDRIAPGPRRVDVVGARSRARQVFETMVDEGADALVQVLAPMGSLLVENLSGQDVIVRVDGVKLGRVPRDAPITVVTAPAGKRLIQVERLGDHTVTGMEVAVAPGHAVHVLVPRALVRLVVVNQTADALRIRVGDRALGEVGPGESAIFEDVEPGDVDLTARPGDKLATHVERRTLRAGETATWVLQR